MRASLLALTLAVVLFAGDARSQSDDAGPGTSGSGASAGGTGAASTAGRVPALESAVRAAERAVDGAKVGIVLMDADSGVVLASAGEHLALNPASNAKLYTAATALAVLHGTHKYQTTLSGSVKSSAVSGGLVLRGQGDPSLRSEDLWAMATDLKTHGIRKVDDIVVDQRFFDDQTTPPAFEQQPNEWASFRAPVSAVALNENTVTLTIRPTTAGSPAVAVFDPPGFVDVEGTVKTADAGADTVGLDLIGAGHRLSAKLSGAVGGDAKLVRYTRRVEDPQLLAGYALRAVLEETGVKVTGDVKLADAKWTSPKGASTLVHHESEPLSTLLYALGKNSDNFYAEMIFKSLGGEAHGRPARAQDAADVVTKLVEKNGLGDNGFVVKNGSGLFDSNRTTASSLAKLLRWVWQEPAVRAEFVAQLSIGGVDGTLHKRFRDARVHRAIRAKTGTLDDAIALSGYVLGPPGKSTIAFAIVYNHVSGKGSSARAAADKLVEAIHDRQWK